MADFAKELLAVNLEDEMRQSYLDYAMSVIIGRALPDVRDGLKPVHRRVLYAMHELGNDWNKAYKKSARVVGDVIGKYHPHGDTAVYDTIVRMAQPFSLRYMLVDGQGNFGSVDGDAPAAMRYTEVRMSRLAHELLADLGKETVDFVPNYDGAEHEPSVMPSKVPNLLVNGSAGIAVGMATNIPPHNLSEIIGACVALIDDPEIGFSELMEHVPGPDFPTAGIINGRRGILEAYQTGRGKIYVRARCHEETDKAGKTRIVVTELPYQVNKARLLEKIAELVKQRKIDGITELRDESDKDGMRMVIELRRGEVGDVILNNLYQHTQMQNVFGINMVALVDGRPRLINLKEALEAFLRHRREVVTRRTVFDLRKAREKAHVLEGLAVALTNIDEIIALIKASGSPAEAKAGLVSRLWRPGVVMEMLERAGADASRPEDVEGEFGLTEGGYRLSGTQAQAILDLRLHRLTGLEQDKIVKDYSELLGSIAELLDILRNPDRLMQVIREELVDIRERFGDTRRTEIVAERMDLTLKDLIPPEDVVVTLSHAGYAKSQKLDEYRSQVRGGKGKTAAAFKEEDFIDKLFVANTHDTLLCFSSAGRAYWLNVYELPQAGRTARGKPLVNLLPLEKGERINAVMPVGEYEEGRFVFMATAGGTVKKTPLRDFSRPRASGIIALDLREGDRVVNVSVTDGDHDIVLISSAGKAVRFPEAEVRPMGRTACGVRGMRLREDESIIALLSVARDKMQSGVLIATQNGYGKRTVLSEFPAHRRGGQGVIAIQSSERNGAVVGAALVWPDDEIMLITDGGTLVRTPAEQVSELGRNTQGVILIRLGKGELLAEIERVEILDNGDDDAEHGIPDAGDDAPTTLH
ncbi:MAG: DNA gyrase subunit A [Pseudomonadota bacterium]|nr:DNA gyrase subunit A [Pseudomonadota bacterium]